MAMTRWFLIVFTALALPALELCAQRADSARIQLDAVVAVVGTTPITWYDVKERLIERWNQDRNRKSPPGQAELRAEIDSVLGDLVDEELLLAEAKELGVEVPDAQILPLAAATVRQDRERFGSEPEFEKALAEAGMGTPDDFRRYWIAQIRRQKTFSAITQKLSSEKKLVPANVTNEDLEREFQQMKGAIPSRPAAITWRQMVIAPEPTVESRARTRARAESLYVELQRGGDFERIARRESMDPDRSLGGDRGWSRRGMHEPEFDVLAFGTPISVPLRPGQVSRPVETSIGVQIYRIDRVRTGEVQAHHIFLRPAIDTSDLQRTRRLADSVAALVRGGAPFDTLTRKYHDYASKEDAGIIPFVRDSLPPAWQQAFANAKVGDVVVINVAGISDNISKFVVAQVTAVSAAGEMTLADVKENLRDQMAQSGAMRRYLDNLKKEIFVVVYRERAYALAASK